jgi:hypothetical protein
MTDPGTALVPWQLPDPATLATQDDDGKFEALRTCEAIIVQSSVYKGMALAFIKKHELFRTLNYKHWQDYLDERWGLSRSYAHRLIEAAEAVKRLESSLEARKMLPAGNVSVAAAVSTEREARDLRGHEHEVIALVTNGKPLGEAVKAVVEKVRREREDRPAAPAPTPPTAPAAPTGPAGPDGGDTGVDPTDADDERDDDGFTRLSDGSGRVRLRGPMPESVARRLVGGGSAAPTEVKLPTARTVRELQDWLAEQRPTDGVLLYADHLLVVGDSGGAGITIPLGYGPRG